jgi:hypothetical protein
MVSALSDYNKLNKKKEDKSFIPVPAPAPAPASASVSNTPLQPRFASGIVNVLSIHNAGFCKVTVSFFVC